MADISKIEGYNLKDEVARKPILTSITTPANIQHFEDGGDDIPLNSCTVEINAQQDLHGYDKSWAGGGGKNKLPFYTNDEVSGITYTVDSKGVITATGRATGNSRIAQYIYLPAGNYVLSGCSSNSSSGVGDLYVTRVSDSTVLARDYTNIADADRKFTLTEETRLYVAVRFSNVAFAQSATKTFYPQIEVGTSATTYEPYANVCPITGFSSIDVIRQGKNLCPYIEYGSLSQTTGEETSSSTTKRSGWIPVNAGSYIYFSHANSGSDTTIRIFRYKQDKTYIDNGTKGLYGGVGEYEVPANVGYIRFQTSGVNITETNMQVEFGRSATTYETYSPTTFTIPLGQTVYGGSLECVEGEGTITYDELVFDGSDDEPWVVNTSITGFRIDLDVEFGNYQEGLCNYIEVRTSTGTYGYTPTLRLGAGGTSKNRIYFYHISDNISGVSDVETWRTYLSNNPLQIVYKSSTPTSLSVSGANIPTLSGTNNIYTDCGDIQSLEYFNDKADDIASMFRLMTRS